MDHPPQSGDPRLRLIIINKKVVAALILLIAVVGLITSNTFWRWMYPIGYQPEIQQAAKATDVDPLLIASVIRVESKFHSTDVSHAGAIGLMQLMPDTAQWIASQVEESGNESSGFKPGPDLQRLAVPTVNIHLGSWYIHYLIERFSGNEVAAIAAYNGGPKRVQQWLSNGTWNGRIQTLEDMPVGETRHFVTRVMYNYELYKRIYGDDPQWRQGG